MASSRRKPNPMNVSEGFRTFVIDQLAELGNIEARPMFGAVGLYHGGVFFGIVAADVLYLKVDDGTRGDFTAEGMSPFKPYPHRPATRQYFGVPPAVLESPPALSAWARKAIAVAARAAGSTRRSR